MEGYTYETAGFDGFLSRSIDTLPQVNLDSQGPYSTQLAYDRGIQNGPMGDSLRIGTMVVDSKSKTLTLNDGTIIINNSNVDNSIKANSSALNYSDSSGNTAVIEGLLPDNSTGFRLQTPQGLGLAQFSRTVDGAVSLKIAKAGYEVSTATNDQLILNSLQNMLKVVATIPVTVAGITVPTGSSNNSSATIDLTGYPANSIILPIARVSGQPSFLWQGDLGLSNAGSSGSIAGWGVLATYSTTSPLGVPTTVQLTRTIINVSGADYTDNAYSVTVYVLQETAA